jgi:Conserved mid region of cactin
VAKEVAGIFKGKSAEQLAGIQKQIESTISQRAEGVDIGYWESLLSQLKGKLVIKKMVALGLLPYAKSFQLIWPEQGLGTSIKIT